MQYIELPTQNIEHRMDLPNGVFPVGSWMLDVGSLLFVVRCSKFPPQFKEAR